MHRLSSLSIRRCLAVVASSATIALATGFVAPNVAFANNGRADIALTVFPAPAVYGQTVTLSAEMTDVSGSCKYWEDCDRPAGTVTFFDGGTVLGTGVLGDHGPAALDYQSFTSIDITVLQVGFHHYSAQYRGDFDPVSTNDLHEIGKGNPDLTVGQAPCTLGLTVNRASTLNETTPAVFTADLGSPGHVGTVDFLTSSNLLYWRTTIGGDGRTATYPFSAPSQQPGDYTFHAVYYGDTNHTGCTSPDVTHVREAAQVASGTVEVPAANPDQFHVDVNTPIEADILANDLFVDGYVVKPKIFVDPSHGTATLDPVTLRVTYTPNQGYVGADALAYGLVDAADETHGYSEHANVTFNIDCRAAGLDDSFTVVRDTPLVVADSGVLGNDQACGGGVALLTQAAHGTVTLGAAGGFTYAPAGGYTGLDSFRYTLDNDINDTPVTVNLVVVDPVCNVALGDDSYTTTGALTVASPGVVGNDELCGNAVDVAQQPAYGSVVIAPGGGFTYTPFAGYVGPDTFTYGIAVVPDDQQTLHVEAVDPEMIATVHLTVVAAQVTPSTPTTTPPTTPPTTTPPTTGAPAAPGGQAIAPTPVVADPSNADPNPSVPMNDILPITGSNSSSTALVALVTVFAGAALVRLTRRRPVS